MDKRNPLLLLYLTFCYFQLAAKTVRKESVIIL